MRLEHASARAPARYAASRTSLLLLTALFSLALAGCERAMQNMYDQPRYKPLRAAPELGGSSSQPLPRESVLHSQGNLAGTSSGVSGEADTLRDERATAAQTMPYPVTADLVHRGQERYNIYCMPCHSPLGDGDGLVARRGFPHPPSYHIARLRDAPDRHFYDVITNGYGIMYSYADRVSPGDRWAIVAYIRALQLSQNAQAARLPPQAREHLAKSGAANDAARRGNEAPAQTSGAVGQDSAQRAGGVR